MSSARRVSAPLHKTAPILRFAQDGSKEQFTTGEVWLVFFVLVRLIQGEPAELVGDFEQMLVAVVPVGAHLAEKHRSLVGPAQLQKSYSTDMSAEPAGIFHVVAVGELRVGQALHHVVQFGTLKRPGM